jgi:hypothetical protein
VSAPVRAGGGAAAAAASDQRPPLTGARLVSTTHALPPPPPDAATRKTRWTCLTRTPAPPALTATPATTRTPALRAPSATSGRPPRRCVRWRGAPVCGRRRAPARHRRLNDPRCTYRFSCPAALQKPAGTGAGAGAGSAAAGGGAKTKSKAGGAKAVASASGAGPQTIYGACAQEGEGRRAAPVEGSPATCAHRSLCLWLPARPLFTQSRLCLRRRRGAQSRYELDRGRLPGPVQRAWEMRRTRGDDGGGCNARARSSPQTHIPHNATSLTPTPILRRTRTRARRRGWSW